MPAINMERNLLEQSYENSARSRIHCKRFGKLCMNIKLIHSFFFSIVKYNYTNKSFRCILRSKESNLSRKNLGRNRIRKQGHLIFNLSRTKRHQSLYNIQLRSKNAKIIEYIPVQYLKFGTNPYRVTHMESPLKTRVNINVLFAIVLRQCTVSKNLAVMKAMRKKWIVYHSPESCRPLSLSKHKVNGSTGIEKKNSFIGIEPNTILYIIFYQPQREHVLR